ncbi:MAG: NAD(P)-dependent alcohol dehydrogenase [Anaerolineales bacterium]|jgi:NADPH:quinone reductase-like Zn-dependent oxidoreductase
MKAVIWTQYGPPEVLELGQVEKPVPGDGEILIRVHATTVTKGDCEMRSLDFPFLLGIPMRIWMGFFKPKRGKLLGTEFAGVIEEMGKNVTRFKVGDEVFGSAGMNLGTNAEYICLSENPDDMGGAVAIKPENMTFEEAATIPFGARDSLHFIRLGNIQSGDRILINGAGGSIGVFAVQLAKLKGAEVTAVDSVEKLDMLRELGADHVIDYRSQDFTESGIVYDVIFDVVGTVRFSKANNVLKPGGAYLLANPISQMLSGSWTRMTTDRQVIMQVSSPTLEDLITVRKLIEAGKLQTVIDRSYPLEQIVEAHHYVETGAKMGNLVITV